MHSIAISIFIFYLASSAAGQRPDRRPTPACPDKQVWLDCGPTCEERKCGESPRECTENPYRCGNPGCYCIRRHVRNQLQECVLPEECPNPSLPISQQRCRAGEIFSECGNHCERKCPTEVDSVGDRQPAMCDVLCGTPNCTCKPGFLRDHRGNCVRLENCPDLCGENEKYSRCGNLCERTCDHFLSGAPFRCNRFQCQEPACVCKDGFYRNNDGRCVKNYQCLTCPPNEIAHPCAMPAPCQRHCSLEDWENPCRTNGCQPGCVCPSGFVRDSRQVCVAQRHCFAPRPHH